MNTSATTNLPGTTTFLFTVVFIAASTLSVKCSLDLTALAHRFPSWFVPTFVVGIVALVSYSAVMVFRTLWLRDTIRWARGPEAAVIWVLLPVSFLCTSAVHGFFPFRPTPIIAYRTLDPILKLNLALTAFGFIASAACGMWYARGKHAAATTGLLGLAVLLLVPNDACRNPFNEWWLSHVGASPLMFVPNLFAIVLGTSALVGVHRRLNTVALAAVGLSVGLLGLGHIFRVVW